MREPAPTSADKAGTALNSRRVLLLVEPDQLFCPAIHRGAGTLGHFMLSHAFVLANLCMVDTAVQGASTNAGEQGPTPYTITSVDHL
jgi:hypothetical protein